MTGHVPSRAGGAAPQGRRGGLGGTPLGDGPWEGTNGPVHYRVSVVTKLVDRGSAQTMGLVTDTGLFVHQLADKLS